MIIQIQYTAGLHYSKRIYVYVWRTLLHMYEVLSKNYVTIIVDYINFEASKSVRLLIMILSRELQIWTLFTLVFIQR